MPDEGVSSADISDTPFATFLIILFETEIADDPSTSIAGLILSFSVDRFTFNVSVGESAEPKY
jgi:hypothetical protein